MPKNISILYLKDKESKNSKFISFLKKEYKTEVYNCVLPNIYESRLGDLTLKINKNRGFDNWYSEISNETDKTIYHFGIDHIWDVDHAFWFKICFINHLKSLKFEFNDKTSVNKILSSIKRSSLFIQEKYLNRFDVIIIENLATAVFDRINPYVKIDPLYKPKYPSYIKYKITPYLLNNLLNSGKKIIHLMDFDKTSFEWMVEFKGYEKMLKRIGIGSYYIIDLTTKDSINIEEQVLVGIDFQSKFRNSKNEFRINIDSNYKPIILEKYKYLYRNVKSIQVKNPIQLSIDGFLIEDDKIFLRGDKKTTNLYPNENNFKNILPESEESIITLKRETSVGPIFGISEISKAKSYVSLTGHICCSKFFSNPFIGNKQFIKNVINYITEGLSNIKIVIDPPELFIDNVKITLGNMEFCYYRYFVERAYNGEDFTTIADDDQSDYNCNKEVGKEELTTIKNDEYSEHYSIDVIIKKSEYISPKLFKKIIQFHKDSFGADGNRSRSEKKLKNKQTLKISETYNKYMHEINKSIKSSLNLSDEKINKLIISKVKIKGKAHYGIYLPPENIEIVSSVNTK